MTDHREMLELAAKAAGYVLTDGSSGYRTFRCYAGAEWNPLTDDGDALRLAVSLGLVVDCSRPSAAPPYRAHTPAEIGASDPYAATRRAIVRAAAEIGRQME